MTPSADDAVPCRQNVAHEPGPPLGRYGRFGFSFRLHYLLFVAFTLIAALPIGGLAFWASSTSFQNECASVQERNLLLARTLTSTMSRYVRDVEAVFGLAITRGVIDNPGAGLINLLTSLNVTDVRIIGPDGHIESQLTGLLRGTASDWSPALLAELGAMAAVPSGHTVLSSLHYDSSGQPVFYLVQRLPQDRLALGVLSTNYLVSLQQAIAFNHGYVVIVDAKGQVIAQPLRDPVAASHEISSVPAMAAMMHGESGVGQFYLPAFNGDMLVGFAVVPETGWDVMVLQSIAELRRGATWVNEMATVIAAIPFLSAGLLAWFAALYLARPVRLVADTATAVPEGNDDVLVPPFTGLVPREIRQLGAAFNAMLQALRCRAAETRKALQDAEHSSAAKSQFLANMSHEIRTPLNGIVGMIELMQMTELTPAQQRHVETAAQSSQALLRLIDDILDLSRIEAGRLQLVIAAFHLPTMIHDVRQLFAEQVRAKGLTLLLTVPDELNLVVGGDKHRLQQVLSNLVSNAIKFTTQGTIAVRCLREQEIDGAIRIRFEVSDSGIGVPNEKQAEIFEAFTQADNSMTRRYGGTGLGLSIARQLVTMMDGDIGVQSTVGLGSTFWFTVVLQRLEDAPLPASPRQPAGAEPTVKTGAGPAPAFISLAGQAFRAALEGHGRKSVAILLVEDNPANLRVTQALLETLGCQVATATNGLEAISVYRENSYDLVLMDCQMPEMDGYKATRAIRQLERIQCRRTPIVALTAHAMESSRDAALESGMDDQITKPLTMAILTRKLLQWLVPAQPSPS